MTWLYVLRPMPDCIANPEAKDRDELIGLRFLPAADMSTG